MDGMAQWSLMTKEPENKSQLRWSTMNKLAQMIKRCSKRHEMTITIYRQMTR